MTSLRIAVISDVHANYHALSAVLDDIDARGIPALWCLGDIIGRGAFPVEVTRALWRRYRKQTKEHQQAWLCGNHEMMLLERIPVGFLDVNGGETTTVSGDNQYAVDMILQHQRELKVNPSNQTMMTWLDGLPPYRLPLFERVLLAHGTYLVQSDGNVDEDATYRTYLLEDASINDMLRRLIMYSPHRCGLVMCGHTHVSRLVVWDEESERGQSVPKHQLTSHTFDLTRQLVYINTGSVGFPRKTRHYDDICPTYVILTTEDMFQTVSVEFVHVSYKSADVQLPPNYPLPYRNEMGRCHQQGENQTDNE